MTIGEIIRELENGNAEVLATAFETADKIGGEYGELIRDRAELLASKV